MAQPVFATSYPVDKDGVVPASAPLPVGGVKPTGQWDLGICKQTNDCGNCKSLACRSSAVGGACRSLASPAFTAARTFWFICFSLRPTPLLRPHPSAGCRTTACLFFGCTPCLVGEIGKDLGHDWCLFCCCLSGFTSECHAGVSEDYSPLSPMGRLLNPGRRLLLQAGDHAHEGHPQQGLLLLQGAWEKLKVPWLCPTRPGGVWQGECAECWRNVCCMPCVLCQVTHELKKIKEEGGVASVGLQVMQR
jgi:hypothetical protein